MYLSTGMACGSPLATMFYNPSVFNVRVNQVFVNLRVEIAAMSRKRR